MRKIAKAIDIPAIKDLYPAIVTILRNFASDLRHDIMYGLHSMISSAQSLFKNCALWLEKSYCSLDVVSCAEDTSVAPETAVSGT